MKLEEAFNQKPTGKGCQPKTEKQASQWAYYDTITKLWKFPKPLSYSLIEKLNLWLTGQPRGISLEVWTETVNFMNELRDLSNPFGFLRWELTKRIKGNPTN